MNFLSALAAWRSPVELGCLAFLEVFEADENDADCSGWFA
jgi:hypothetical protein